MGTPLSAATWVHLIATLVERGVSNFVLTGGEPTLLPDFDHLTAALARHTTPHLFYISSVERRSRAYPVSFVILTNGDTTTWTPAFCRSLAGARCRVHVHLAGPAGVHDAITGGDHARTLRTIHYLLEAGVDLVLNLPLLPENLDTAGKVLREILAMGVRQVNVMRLLPVGHARGGGARLNLLTPPAFLHAYQEIVRACRAQGATCGVGSLIPACAFPTEGSDPWSLESLPHVCGCGTQSFCIDPAGLVRPCTCSPVIGGTISRLEEAVAGDAFRAFRQRSHPAACDGCSLQSRCSGGCPAVWYGTAEAPQGDPWITPPSHGGLLS